jgi:outer membrane beta-barrel protein
MNWKALCLSASLLAAFGSTTAYAQDDDEAALVEKVAVRNKLFSVAGRWELGANAGLSLLSRLTDHYNFNVSVARNFAEWLGLELRGGYAYSRHTSLADQIAADFAAQPTSSIATANELSDLWQMTANATVGLRFQPIYGKLGLMAELPVHFQLYVWLGGGFGLFHRESLTVCTQFSGTRECSAWRTEDKPGPLISGAVGFRFFIAGKHSVKAEIRDYSYLDSYYINVQRSSANANNPTGGGTLSPNAGISNLVQFDLGYSFLF